MIGSTIGETMVIPVFTSESVTFETAHITTLPVKCTSCGVNPPAFKHGPNQACCLPCACRRLAEMAQRGIDQWINLPSVG